MDKLKEFIHDLTSRVSSRKFIVLLIAVGLHLRNAEGFTGDNLVWVFSIFIGFNVAQKYMETLRK